MPTKEGALFGHRREMTLAEIEETYVTAMDYPKFFSTMVGLAPNKVKQFSGADVAALCAVFQTFVEVDPLTATVPLAEIMKRRLAEQTEGMTTVGELLSKAMGA